MGHQFTVDGDEAYRLDTELAGLMGESLDAAVTTALCGRMVKEQERRAEVAAMLAAVHEFRALFGDDPPSSDHGWLYDEQTGLPA